MTTIAFRDGVAAADTLITSGNCRVGAATKVRTIGSLLYGSTGNCGLSDRFEAWLRGGASGDVPELKAGDETADVLVLMPDDALVWFFAQGSTRMRAPYYAFGSGREFAMGAMAAGASAEEAVAAAIQHDNGSGGPITVLRRAA